MNGSYVDDPQRVGDSEFQEECCITHKQSETSEDIQREPDETLYINQAFHLKKLEEMNRQSSGFSDFCSIRIKLACMSKTRQGLQFKISRLDQTTQKHFDINVNACIKKPNDAVSYSRKNNPSFIFPKL